MLTLSNLLDIVIALKADDLEDLASKFRDLSPDQFQALILKLNAPKGHIKTVSDLAGSVEASFDSFPKNWPFEDWLRLAVNRFYMPPNVFWETSLRDWLALISTQTETGLDQAGLRALMQAFPDQKASSHD